ncbi:MAG: hypothetical protein HC825_11905 [Oscillatoriales cyanobacterium RM1_1_9]|nr:hypothetical protein [Oscillatoriales cyanobacterium RM1_1_9]
MDRIKLQNPEALLACLDDHPQVKLVVFGHIHQGFQTSHNGVTYLGCPSTCVQFQPLAAEFTLDQMATPGFRVLTLYPDGTFDTQVGRTTYPLPPLP